MDVLSLDVFETCIVRDVGQQEGVWHLVSRRLRENGRDVPTDVAFAELRGTIEQALRDASPKEDVSLAEVYGALGVSLGWTPEWCVVAAEVECQVECQVARANPRALDLVRQANPDAIWYLSDTVLPASLLQEVLRSHGFPNGMVVTSGDEGLRKMTGSLFRRAAGREGVNPQSVRHVGNDVRVDGGGSARSGVRFLHLAEGNYNRYETGLDSPSSRTYGLVGSCLAAASRRCRLEAAPTEDPGLLSIESSVAGPTIFACAAWALAAARADGVHRLCFAARDGQILLRAARIIQERLGVAPDIECRYLYGSRLAWHLAASHIVGWERAAKDLLNRESGQSLRTMLRLFQLSEEESGAVADAVLPSGLSLDDPIDDSSGQITERLTQLPLLRSLWTERSALAHRNTVLYLEQEGLLTDESVGLVDIGWLGRASGALAAIAEAEGSTLRCYFAGGLAGAGSASAPADSRAYLVEGRGIDVPDLTGMVHLLETFCSGTEGSAVGYEVVEGTYRPTLDSPANEVALRWGLDRFQGAVARYVERACEGLLVANEELEAASLEPLKFPIRRNLGMLWNDPSGGEAKAWGSFPYETNSGSVVALASLPSFGSISSYLRDPANKRQAVRVGPWLAADWMLIVAPFGGETLFRTSRRMYQRVRNGLSFEGLRLAGRMNHRLSRSRWGSKS